MLEKLKITCEDQKDIILDILRVLSLKKSELIFLEMDQGAIYIQVKHGAGSDKNDVARTLQLLPGVNKVEEVNELLFETREKIFFALLDCLELPLVLLGTDGTVQLFNAAAKQYLNLEGSVGMQQKGEHLIVNREINDMIETAAKTGEVQEKYIKLNGIEEKFLMQIKPILNEEVQKVASMVMILKDETMSSTRASKTTEMNWDSAVAEMLKQGYTLAEIMEMMEKKVLAKAISDCGSARKTAKFLGVSHTTILNKLNKYKELEEFLHSNDKDALKAGEDDTVEEEIKQSATSASRTSERDQEISEILEQSLTFQKKGDLENQNDQSKVEDVEEAAVETSQNKGNKKERKKCSNCGAELKYGAVFCPNCFFS